MKTIGIKLADGTFYPVIEEGSPKQRMLDLTTVKDNQTKVQIDLYRSETGTMDDAEYVDTLEVPALNPHPNGEPELHLSVSIDENNELKAEVIDAETGTKSETQVNLITRSDEDRQQPNDFEISDFELPPVAGDVTPEENKADDDKTIVEEPASDTKVQSQNCLKILQTFLQKKLQSLSQNKQKKMLLLQMILLKSQKNLRYQSLIQTSLSTLMILKATIRKKHLVLKKQHL